MSKILILGSSGQVGSHLCDYMEQRNHEVLRFDIVEMLKKDLRIPNNKLLDTYMNESDFVYFLAFDVGGSPYLQKYQHTFEFTDNNIKLMCNTFDALNRHKKPFIFASSQMSNMDYSTYGTLKRIGEIYTKALNGITVKFWNVYGIEKDFEKSHVITDFIIKAKNTGIIDMLTDGTEERQFLYSEDCCEALDIVRKKYDILDRDCELHISSHVSNTILDVANEIAKHIPAEIVPSKCKDTIQQDKKNEANPYILNFWKPKTSFSDGIKIMCELQETSNV